MDVLFTINGTSCFQIVSRRKCVCQSLSLNHFFRKNSQKSPHKLAQKYVEIENSIIITTLGKKSRSEYNTFILCNKMGKNSKIRTLYNAGISQRQVYCNVFTKKCNAFE